MTSPRPIGRLIVVDGLSHGAIRAAARETIARAPRRERGGISWWDASGLFHELAMADAVAGTASARTLLLLYAADLAFRLRWEIRPLLAEGRTVVAAPYIRTASAFGRAAGIPDDWIRDLFQFAPQPDESMMAVGLRRKRRVEKGFIEFGCEYLGMTRRRSGSHQIVERARVYLTRP